MIGGQGTQAFVAFFSNLILVRYLVPEEFGRFAWIQATIGLAASTLSLRINTILLQAPEGELQPEKKDLYFSALVGQTLVVFLGSLILLWIFRLWDLWAVIILLSMLVNPWVYAQGVLYERSFRYKNLSLVESGSHLASHIFSVIGVVGGLGPAVLYLRGWIHMVFRLSGLAWVGGLESFKVRWLSSEEWRFVFQKVRGFWFEGWLTQIFERLVIVLLGTLEGQQITGYFFQARRLAMTPHQLLEPVTSRILFNFLSHRASPERGIQVLRQVVIWQAPLLISIAILAIIGADPIIPWIFGSGWEPVVPIFQAMVGVLICMTPFYTLGAYFKAQNNMWPFIVFGLGFQYIAIGVTLLITSFANISLVYGIAGGLSVGFIGGFLLLTVTLKVFREEEVKELFEIK